MKGDEARREGGEAWKRSMEEKRGGEVRRRRNGVEEKQ